MNNLIVDFGGMSLILSGGNRSEALMVSTAGSDHKHKHAVVIQEKETPVEQAVMWIEEDGRPLTGPLTDAATFVARVSDLTPQDPLNRTLKTTEPEKNFDWQRFVSVWFRLPGGELTTEKTGGKGGSAVWEFPPFDGQPAKKRQLTQYAILTKTGVAGSVRLAILKHPGGKPDYVDVPKNDNGDFVIGMATEYDGIIIGEPQPGTRVELSEIQFLYNCLDSPKGPIPSIIWPANARANSVSKWSLRGINFTLLTDPVTGICPIGLVSV
jgi:hypothetical protein